MPPKLGQKSFVWDYFVTVEPVDSVEPVEGQKGQAKEKMVKRKSCQIIRKCRIESNTKIYEIARNFAKIGPFSYKISTFAKSQKPLS